MATPLAHSSIENYSVKGKTFALVISQYHRDITSRMATCCSEILLKQGVIQEDIFFHEIPGAFELPIAAAQCIAHVDVVIAIGCLIRGETKHFDFIASAVAHGLTQLSLQHTKPVIFGVLTTETIEQAIARAEGGKAGNKGVEIAHAAIQMSHFKFNGK